MIEGLGLCGWKSNKITLVCSLPSHWSGRIEDEPAAKKPRLDQMGGMLVPGMAPPMIMPGMAPVVPGMVPPGLVPGTSGYVCI